MVFYRVYAFLINRFLRRSVYAPSLIPFHIILVLFSVICTRAEGTRVLSETLALKAAGFVCLFVYVRMYYIIVPLTSVAALPHFYDFFLSGGEVKALRASSAWSDVIVRMFQGYLVS